MENERLQMEAALLYITDCLLATVDGMAMVKPASRRDYKRHISIAQKAVDYLSGFHINPKGTRAEEICHIQSVRKWALNISNRWGHDK
jgi:hypothetical protein